MITYDYISGPIYSSPFLANNPMDRTITVHIGKSRCASTFIQSTLLYNRKILENAGILYPHAKPWALRNGYTDNITTIIGMIELSSGIRTVDGNYIYNHLRSLLLEKHVRHIVLSCEELFLINPYVEEGVFREFIYANASSLGARNIGLNIVCVSRDRHLHAASAWRRSVVNLGCQQGLDEFTASFLDADSKATKFWNKLDGLNWTSHEISKSTRVTTELLVSLFFGEHYNLCLKPPPVRFENKAMSDDLCRMYLEQNRTLGIKSYAVAMRRDKTKLERIKSDPRLIVEYDLSLLSGLPSDCELAEHIAIRYNGYARRQVMEYLILNTDVMWSQEVNAIMSECMGLSGLSYSRLEEFLGNERRTLL